MALSATIVSAAVIGSSVYSAKKASKTQAVAQAFAEKNAKEVSTAAERANNAQNAKSPDLASLVLLGKSTLLGS
jgi:hypothetical protein